MPSCTTGTTVQGGVYTRFRIFNLTSVNNSASNSYILSVYSVLHVLFISIRFPKKKCNTICQYRIRQTKQNSKRATLNGLYRYRVCDLSKVLAFEIPDTVRLIATFLLRKSYTNLLSIKKKAQVTSRELLSYSCNLFSLYNFTFQ